MTARRAIRQVRHLLVILLAAAVVCAGTAGVVQSSAFTSVMTRGSAGRPPGAVQERGGPPQGAAAAQAGGPVDAQGDPAATRVTGGRGNPAGPGGGRSAINLQAGAPQVARWVLIMAILTAAVAFTLNVRQRQRRRRAAPARSPAIHSGTRVL